jgi:hypothetical protein
MREGKKGNIFVLCNGRYVAVETVGHGLVALGPDMEATAASTTPTS